MTGETLLAVDPLTGDRSTISGDGVGTGPELRNLRRLVSGPSGVYVVTSEGDFLQIDIPTGDRTLLAEARVGSGPLPDFGDVAVDPATGAILLLDDSGGPLVHMDPATGIRTEIPGTDDADRVTFDPASGVAYFLARNEVHALDVGTGATQEISGAAVGAGPLLSGADDLSHGPTPGTLVVNDYDLGVVSIELATGDRSILTPLSDFTGSEFGEPYGVTSDPQSGMVFVADNGVDHVFGIDGTSGLHTSLVDLYGLFGVDINDAVFQSWDDRVYVAAEGYGEIFRVDPTTGDAVIVSSEDVGTGPRIDGLYHLDAAPHTGVVIAPDIRGKLVALDLLTSQRVVIAR